MDKNKRLLFSDKNIKFLLGYLEINIVNINYEPPVPHRYFGSHSHSTYELHYIPQGEGLLKVQHQQYNITPGTFYLTGPGILHEQVADGNQPMSEYCLNFEFEIKKERHPNFNYYNSSEIDAITAILQKTSFWYGKDEFSTFSLFEKLYWEIENRILGYYSNMQSLAAQIIVNAARSFSAVKKAGYDIPGKLSYDKRRVMIDDYFRNYDRKLKAPVLAKELGVSTRQLDRLMKQFYSMSFKQKLLHTRMEIALNLLRDTDLSAKEIAQSVGFSNYSHFYKAFMEREKVSPSEYKKQMPLE